MRPAPKKVLDSTLIMDSGDIACHFGPTASVKNERTMNLQL